MASKASATRGQSQYRTHARARQQKIDPARHKEEGYGVRKRCASMVRRKGDEQRAQNARKVIQCMVDIA